MSAAADWMRVGVIVTLGSLVFAWVGTWMVLRYARTTGLLDLPNERSSHHVPTPRGGGLAVAVVIVLCALGVAVAALDARVPLVALGLTVGAMALLGWIDDRRGIPIVPRFAVQFLLASVLLVAVGWPMRAELFGLEVPLGVTGVLVAVLWLVWMTNLFNFMDGIDGIAGVQALVAAAFFSLWFAAFGVPALAVLASAVAAASAGFLLWNWQPARIFMGDSGSLSLGFVLGGLALIGVVVYGMPWGAFILVLAPFIADATWTLGRRMVLGERWWQAHRSHVYQRAVALGWSHAQVSTIVLLTGIVLGLLGTLELIGVEPRWLWAVAAVGLLVGLAAIVKARENKNFGRKADKHEN